MIRIRMNKVLYSNGAKIKISKHNRCGEVFTGIHEFPNDHFTEAQLERMKRDPMLHVKIDDVPAADVETVVAPAPDVSPEPEVPADEPAVDDDADRVLLSDMTLKELQELCRDESISPGNKSKSKLIGLLEHNGYEK